MVEFFMLMRYFFKSIFTSPDKINKANIFGNAIDKIIMSPMSVTAFKLNAQPKTVQVKYSTL